MDAAEHLGYQYRMVEFDSDETFDDFFTGRNILHFVLDHVMLLQVIVPLSWS